ncbi:DUF397 domain-containing protein [Streptomyces sp. NPDC096205]|uniref:DUF397 domain-containing protein n=1 Tax=Streptomyces sp. NPDC096205 TaxID=3366081 RepID=UPI00381B257A
MQNQAIQWRKSSYSGDQGGQCVECAPIGALAWRKSSYSSDQGGQCLEVCDCPATVSVRDSKNPAGPVLSLRPAVFTAFTKWAAATAAE